MYYVSSFLIWHNIESIYYSPFRDRYTIYQSSMLVIMAPLIFRNTAYSQEYIEFLLLFFVSTENFSRKLKKSKAKETKGCIAAQSFNITLTHQERTRTVLFRYWNHKVYTLRDLGKNSFKWWRRNRDLLWKNKQTNKKHH